MSTDRQPGALAPVVVSDLSVSFRDRQVALRASTSSPSPAGGSAWSARTAPASPRCCARSPARLPVPARVHRAGSTGPATVVLLGQEPPFRDDDTVGEVLATTLRPLREAVGGRREAGRRPGRPEAAGGVRAGARVGHPPRRLGRRPACRGRRGRLGLGVLDPARRVGTLSGGQRTRLALATVMTTRPDCLLLDEPTNHLDDDAIEVLSRLPARPPRRRPAGQPRPGAARRRVHRPGRPRPVRARHRRPRRAAVRRRLDGVPGAPRGRPPPLGGDVRRAAGAAGPARGGDAHRDGGDRPQPRPARQRQVHLRVQGRQRRPGAGPAQEGRRAAARRGPARPGAQAARAAALRLGARPAAERRGRVVLVRDLVGPRAGCALDRLDVHAGEHLLVTGPNGSGKSTLLGVLSGRLAADSGTVQRRGRAGGRARAGRRLPRPAGARRSRRTPRALGAEDAPSDVRCGVSGCCTRGTCARPSGCCRSVSGAGSPWRSPSRAGPDLLLLDEPTNHLSLGAGRRARGGPAAQPRHRRRRLARPLAASSVDRPHACPVTLERMQR